MPEVEAIKAAGIKCVDVWLTPQDQAAFAQDLQTAGYEVTMFGNDETNSDDTFSKLAGKLADGMITAQLTTDLHPSNEVLAFREEYKRRFNVEATPFAEGSYDSIMMLAQVIKAVGSTEPEALQKGFNSVKNFPGLTGSLSFDEKNHITITADQITLVKYDAAKNGWMEVKD
jgi:ABC-type branched-subunit amino acid transport system substrate-binding protein